MGKIPVSSPVKAGGPPGACRLPFLPDLNGTLPLSKGPQTPSVIYLSLASGVFDSHSVWELCLVDGAEQADPRQTREKVKDAASCGHCSPIPAPWMDEQSHGHEGQGVRPKDRRQPPDKAWAQPSRSPSTSWGMGAAAFAFLTPQCS